MTSNADDYENVALIANNYPQVYSSLADKLQAYAAANK